MASRLELLVGQLGEAQAALHSDQDAVQEAHTDHEASLAELGAASSTVARGRRNASKLEVLLGGEAELVQRLEHGQSRQQEMEEMSLQRVGTLQLRLLQARASERRSHHGVLELRGQLERLLPLATCHTEEGETYETEEHAEEHAREHAFSDHVASPSSHGSPH